MPRKSTPTVSVRIHATIYPQLVAAAEQFGCNITTLLSGIAAEFVASGRNLTVTYTRDTPTPQSVAPTAKPTPRVNLKDLSDEEQADFMDSDFDTPEQWLAAKKAKSEVVMSAWVDDEDE